MDDLIFYEHAWEEMRRDSVSEAEVYHVIGDADEVIERDDGRTIYVRVLDDGRQIFVVVEDETRIVETVWWNKPGSRRRSR